jgi:hypothetical protein
VSYCQDCANTEKQLASAQATCAKLHDLNHMQSQRIEVLQAQCETRAKRIYELEQERIVLCEGNKKAGEYWQKKCAKLEKQLIDAGLDRR